MVDKRNRFEESVISCSAQNYAARTLKSFMQQLR